MFVSSDCRSSRRAFFVPIERPVNRHHYGRDRSHISFQFHGSMLPPSSAEGRVLQWTRFARLLLPHFLLPLFVTAEDVISRFHHVISPPRTHGYTPVLEGRMSSFSGRRTQTRRDITWFRIAVIAFQMFFVVKSVAGGQTSPQNQFIEPSRINSPIYFNQTLAVADFNRDGKPDLLVNYFPGRGVGLAVLLAQDAGNYAPEYVSNSAEMQCDHCVLYPDDHLVADLNGDGIPDIIAVHESNRDSSRHFLGNGSIDIYFGKGDGTFQNGVRVANGQFRSPFVVDVNGDGVPDVIV